VRYIYFVFFATLTLMVLIDARFHRFSPGVSRCWNTSDRVRPHFTLYATCTTYHKRARKHVFKAGARPLA
jgi:hypothetical protein